MNEVFTLIAEVGAPIAGALLAGAFIFMYHATNHGRSRLSNQNSTRLLRNACNKNQNNEQ